MDSSPRFNLGQLVPRSRLCRRFSLRLCINKQFFLFQIFLIPLSYLTEKQAQQR